MSAEPEALIARMAAREAALLLAMPPVSTWLERPPVRVSVRVLPCPTCGAQHGSGSPESPAGSPPAALPGVLALDEVCALAADQPPDPGSILLTALACEWLTARSLVVLCRAAREDSPGVPRALLTRGVAVSELIRQGLIRHGLRGHGLRGQGLRGQGLRGTVPAGGAGVAALGRLLAELDRREGWFPLGEEGTDSRPAGANRSSEPAVLPSSSRCGPDGVSRWLGPHPVGDVEVPAERAAGALRATPTGYEDLYRHTRDRVVAHGLGYV